MYKRTRRRRGFSNSPNVHLISSEGRAHSILVSLDDIIDAAEGVQDQYYPSQINNSAYTFLHVNSFGTQRLYKLVSTEKLLNFIRANPDAAHCGYVYDGERSNFVNLESPNNVSVMYFGLFDQDVPATERVNFNSRLLPLKSIPLSMMLMMMTQRDIVNGLNAFYEKYNLPTRAHLGFSKYNYNVPTDPVIDEYGNTVTDPNELAMFCYNHALASTVLEGDIPFEQILPDLSPDNFASGKYRYYIENYSRAWFSNNLNVHNFHRVLIYIPGFDLWQELNPTELDLLQRMETFKISYARVNALHCYDKVWFNSEFHADTVEDLLFNAIAIPTDITWRSMFHWQRTDTSSPKRYHEYTDEEREARSRAPIVERDEYEALGFDVKCYDYNMSLVLTQEEIGVNNPSYRKSDGVGIEYGPLYNNRRGDFSMLDLIINIMKLRPSMGYPFQEPGDNDVYCS